jgi:hypothetical protein
MTIGPMPKQDRSLDDLPLAAYGGSGMEEDAPEADADASVQPAAGSAPRVTPVVASGAGGGLTLGTAPSPGPANALPVPEGEPSHGPSTLSRVGHLFRTSRVAAGAGFVVVIVVGLVLLSSGGASPGATAATPTKGPTAAPTISPPSGDASVVLSGALTGTFPMTGAAGGQHVDATTVTLGWADAQQTTLSIAGPLDRGTRTTDERLVLVIGALVNGQPVTFTSTAGECTIGMASVAGMVQGSFTCHRLKSADGKLTIEATGNYRT